MDLNYKKVTNIIQTRFNLFKKLFTNRKLIKNLFIILKKSIILFIKIY